MVKGAGRATQNPNRAAQNAKRAVPTPDRAVQIQLGARMRMLREARDWTQTQLGDRCDISQKYVSELERGRKSPSWDLIITIAHQGFEIRLATLMFGIDEDVGAEPQHIHEVLAGRSKEARSDVLRAVQLLLKAGEAAK